MSIRHSTRVKEYCDRMFQPHRLSSAAQSVFDTADEGLRGRNVWSQLSFTLVLCLMLTIASLD